MPRSRRLKQAVADSGGLPEGYGYCRKCKEIRRHDEFYPATNPYLDSNGHMSICKECIMKMFESIYSTEHSIEKTIFKLCKLLDVRWDERAVESALKQTETRDWDINKLFGVYKSKILVLNRTSVNDTDVDLTYQHPTAVNISQTKLEDNEFQGSDELIKFWGIDDKEDIEFLENEYANFKKTHKADTYSEIVLLKEVCFKLLEIHKDRKLGALKDSSLKSLQEIMKSLAISPNQANAASAGKSQDSFGMWIKDIESTTPAEWIKDKSVFRDVDDLEAYGEKFITSPLRALVTGSREFTLDGSEETDDSEGE